MMLLRPLFCARVRARSCSHSAFSLSIFFVNALKARFFILCLLAGNRVSRLAKSKSGLRARARTHTHTHTWTQKPHSHRYHPATAAAAARKCYTLFLLLTMGLHVFKVVLPPLSLYPCHPFILALLLTFWIAVKCMCAPRTSPLSVSKHQTLPPRTEEKISKELRTKFLCTV